jgi:hypothetical protein
MFKKIKVSLLCLVFLLSVSTYALAADATANVTANYSTPLTIQEVQPFTFTLTKKPGSFGTNINISNLQQELFSTKQYFNGATYTPGCIKITGNPNATVKVTITPGTTITGATGTTVTLGTISQKAGKSANSCGDAFTNIYQSTINGSSNITLDATGTKYILWYIGSDIGPTYLFYLLSATFSEIKADTYSAPVTYSVVYQ